MAFPEDLHPLTRADLDAAADDAAHTAARRHAADVGPQGGTLSNLPARLTAQVERSTGRGVVVLDPPGAWAIKFDGTDPHDIRARGRVLKFSGDVFRRAVRHPGTRGRRLRGNEESDVDRLAERVADDVVDEAVS